MADCDTKHPHVSYTGSHFAEFKFSVRDVNSHSEDASTTELEVPTAQKPGSLEWNKAGECTIIKSRIATNKQFPNTSIFVVDYGGHWLAVAPNLCHIVLCGSDDWKHSMEQANTFAIQWNRQFSSNDVSAVQILVLRLQLRAHTSTPKLEAWQEIGGMSSPIVATCWTLMVDPCSQTIDQTLWMR